MTSLNVNSSSFSPQIGAAYNMSSVAIYVVDLKRVEPLGCPSSRTERLNGRNVSAGGNRTNMRRSFAKGMAGNARYCLELQDLRTLLVHPILTLTRTKYDIILET